MKHIDEAAEVGLVADIRRLYVEDELSLAAIAQRYSRSSWWVRQRLDRVGVATRRRGSRRGVVDPALVAEMTGLYVDKQLTTIQIGERVGMSVSWVAARLHDAGVALRHTRRLSVDENRIRRLYVDERRSMRATGTDLGVGPEVVRRVLVAMGIPIRGRGGSPTIHCDELRRLYIEDGLTTPAIASRLGVTARGVSWALRRCDIPVRSQGTELTTPTAQLQDHIEEGLSDDDIAEVYGVATWAVRRRLHSEGIRRPHAKPDYTRPSPPVDELVRMYVDEEARLAEIATHHQVPHATVRRWLDNAGIERRSTPRRASAGRQVELTAELLTDLYVNEECTAAEIGRHIGVSKKVILTELHRFGIPVRPPGPRRQAPAPTLDRLYDDPDISIVLDRHQVPVMRTPGPLRTRFPDPVPLTAGLLDSLYVEVGLSAAKISLLTGHTETAVRVGLQQAGIAARDESTRSPWTRRHSR